MIRKELAAKDLGDITAILEKCDTIRLGINGGKYPYVVPLSFGFETENGKLVLYFHGAKEGLKHELIAKDPNVCVEADIMHGFVSSGNKTTAHYESVIGFGKAELTDGAESVKGIELIMAHCGQPGFNGNNCIKLGITSIYKITLESVEGKRRFPNGLGTGWK